MGAHTLFFCWSMLVTCSLGMQIKMRDMAKEALDNGTELPERYWKMGRWWIILGSLAFPAIMVVFWLMVYKPSL